MKRLPLLLVLLAGSAMAVAAGVGVIVLYQSQGSVSLTGAAPTATSGHPLGSGAYNLAADAGIPYPSSWTPSKVWCELDSTGTITGGTLRWWFQRTGADAGWGPANGLDQGIGNPGTARWVSTPVTVSGSDGRIYCQPVSVTESGGSGSLTVTYGFRLEKP